MLPVAQAIGATRGKKPIIPGLVSQSLQRREFEIALRDCAKVLANGRFEVLLAPKAAKSNPGKARQAIKIIDPCHALREGSIIAGGI